MFRFIWVSENDMTKSATKKTKAPKSGIDQGENEREGCHRVAILALALSKGLGPQIAGSVRKQPDLPADRDCRLKL
jgi:hypothetical protein